MRKNRIPSGDQHPSRYLSNLALQATDEGADASNWRQGVRAVCAILSLFFFEESLSAISLRK